MEARQWKWIAIICVIMAASSGIVYGAITILSNPVDVNPEPTPTLLLEVDNATPYVGDTITFNATLSTALSNIVVTLRFTNGTVIDAAVTDVGGIALIPYLVTSETAFTVEAVATVED